MTPLEREVIIWVFMNLLAVLALWYIDNPLAIPVIIGISIVLKKADRTKPPPAV